MMWKFCEVYEQVIVNNEVVEVNLLYEPAWYSLQEADALEANGRVVCVKDYKFQKDRPE